jgi:hypothetical protein
MPNTIYFTGDLNTHKNVVEHHSLFYRACSDMLLNNTQKALLRFAPPPPAQRPQHTAQNIYATDLVF